MSDNWDFYNLLVEDKPASIMLDLGIRESLPNSSHPFMGYLSMQMNNPRPDGLSSSEEFDQLCDIGDAIESVIGSSQGNHIYVGRNTTNNYRDFFFYTNDLNSLHQQLETIVTQFEDYNFAMDGREDRDWKTYLNFLYPGPMDIQRIANRRVCTQLEQAGDNLQIQRYIDHRVYFSKKKDLNQYKEFLKTQDFDIVKTGRTKPLIGEHFVDFKRIDIPANIDDILYPVFMKAIELNGSYDGWGCTVVTEVSP